MVAEECIHRHDDAGRTEPALRAVGFCDALLDRVHPGSNRAYSLDSDDGHIVQGAKRDKTRIGRVMMNRLKSAVRWLATYEGYMSVYS